MDEMAGTYGFTDAGTALLWSVEVLRRRRVPKNAAFWREVAEEAAFVGRAWEGARDCSLPSAGVERLDLALKVEAALGRVAARDAGAARLLGWWAWGDWADEARLRMALAVQEKLRREGVRARVSYRYSYAQLARLLGCDKKEAWRRVQAALELLDHELGELVMRLPSAFPQEERVPEGL